MRRCGILLVLLTWAARAGVSFLDDEVHSLVSRLELLAAKESACARGDTLHRAAGLIAIAWPEKAAELRRSPQCSPAETPPPMLKDREPLEAAVATADRNWIEAAAERFLTAVEHSSESPEDYAWFAALRRKHDIIKGGDNASVRVREVLADVAELVRTDFSYNLRTPKGGEVRLTPAPAMVTVVSFWATWCAPCIQELPILERVSRTPGVRIIAVSDEPADDVRAFARQHKVDLPLLLDPARALFDRYRVDALPEILVFDGTGRARARASGLSELELLDLLRKFQ